MKKMTRKIVALGAAVSVLVGVGNMNVFAYPTSDTWKVTYVKNAIPPTQDFDIAYVATCGNGYKVTCDHIGGSIDRYICVNAQGGITFNFATTGTKNVANHASGNVAAFNFKAIGEESSYGNGSVAGKS